MPAVYRGAKLLLPEPARVHIWCNEDEKVRMTRFARARGMTLSGLIRTTVLAHIAREEARERG